MIGTRMATMAAALATLVALALSVRFVLGSPLVTIASEAFGPAEPASVAQLLRPDSLAEVAARRDPFRITRTAAPDRFTTVPPGDPYAPPRPPRPTLTLVGVTLGDEPEALIDGLPGTEGTRVLRLGESLGGLTVRRIEVDRVVVFGQDTTWTLSVRRNIP